MWQTCGTCHVVTTLRTGHTTIGGICFHLVCVMPVLVLVTHRQIAHFGINLLQHGCVYFDGCQPGYWSSLHVESHSSGSGPKQSSLQPAEVPDSKKYLCE
jgi:hypothetical protein